MEGRKRRRDIIVEAPQMVEVVEFQGKALAEPIIQKPSSVDGKFKVLRNGVWTTRRHLMGEIITINIKDYEHLVALKFIERIE